MIKSSSVTLYLHCLAIVSMGLVIYNCLFGSISLSGTGESTINQDFRATEINNTGLHEEWECRELIPCVKCLKKVQRVIHNRVHKCASSTTQRLTSQLSLENSFNWKKKFQACQNYTFYCQTEADEDKLAAEVFNMPTPLFLIKHFHYAHFRRYASAHGMESPVLINVVREPLELVNSYYYFRRYAHPARHLDITPERQAMSYTTCVLTSDHECLSTKYYLWQVPFFCGSESYCREPTRRALEQAIRHVKEEYVVVGTLDRLDDFYKALEILMPQFFKGLTLLYREGQGSEVLTKNAAKYKEPITQEVAEKMKPYLELEYEFYDFLKVRFDKLMECILPSK